MTRKEAIKILKSKMDGSVDTSYEWAEAVRIAIEALRWNEMCEDCRNAMNEMIAKIQEQIAEGPKCKQCLHNPEHPFTTNRSVDPKTGKWVEVEKNEYEGFSIVNMRCNQCGRYAYLVLPKGTKCVYDFCPNCGAKMKGGNTE